MIILVVDGSAWLPMRASAIAALVLGLIVGVYGLARVSVVNPGRRSKPLAMKVAAKAQQESLEARYLAVRAVVDQRVQQLQPALTLTWKELPHPESYGWSSEIRGLSAGWSFQDSWASNLTIASTAFVALVGSADALTAVLGVKPDAALGVITVTGLVSATLIAIGNTVAKLVGPDPTTVTAGGLILSTVFVVLAAGLQVGTVTGSAIGLVTSGSVRAVVIALTVVVGATLLGYAVTTLHTTITSGVPVVGLPGIPDDATTAWSTGAGAEDWEKGVVLSLIRRTYAPWLAAGDEPEGPVSSPALDPTRPGVALAASTTRRRVSLI